jgi:endoglucanase
MTTARFPFSSLRKPSFALALLGLVASCLPIAATGGASGSNHRKRDKGVEAGVSYRGADKAMSPHNLIANATFNDGTSLPWTVSFTAPGVGDAQIVDNFLCVNVKNKGANNWDAQLRHREMVIRRGHTYTITFTAYASHPTKMRAKVGMQGPPYREYWVDNLKLDTRPRTFSGTFTMSAEDDPTSEFAFHVGGNLAYKVPEPFQVCLDDVRLEDPRFTRGAPAEADAPPTVLVNQVGYFPGLAKLATYRGNAREAQPWRLVDAGGKTLAEGKTEVQGLDAPAGEHTHVVDFSVYTKEGKDLRIEVGTDRSHPFDIRKDLYSGLRYEALAYYYHNRSGVEIKLPFAGKQEWTRPAGHVADKSVACAEGSGCSYSLDVAGGWYDAGDHGKYIVNGGISVWTLLNLWERGTHVTGDTKAFADGRMNIPEKGNKVPDLLDEVRWNLEFMLKMQVPDGETLAGMAHHKIHDKEWTALGLAPHDDPMPRFLQAPSTAATLNLAAVGAQCARIWKNLDEGFAARCLEAAEKAYRAAQANPNHFAPPNAVGGGPYDDTRVDDEFYWAAAELFITTGRDEYRDAVTRSPFFLKVPSRLAGAKEEGLPSPMTWQATEALGTLSLAVVPSKLSAKDRMQAVASIRAAADLYLQIIARRGYRVPIEYGTANKSPWGSNSFILNNLVLMGLAFDLSKDRKYLDGVATGMDYIMGRNAMDQTYVTGHGDRPLVNPHHRFWSFQVNEKFPKAPPGAVSGGPNSGLEDPYVQAAGLKGCAAEKCFVDHIEAWSANEITINWNAPFAWVTAFLDEQGGAPARGGAVAGSAPAKRKRRR